MRRRRWRTTPPTAAASFHLLHQSGVITRPWGSLLWRRVCLAMAIETRHLIGGEVLVRVDVRLDRHPFRRAVVTMHAVVVVELDASRDRLLIGARRVARQVPEPGHLGLEPSAEAVVTVTLVALILGNPLVLKVQRGQR